MVLRIGVDVGGTNTDAVLLSPTSDVVAHAKCTTTEDIVSGIVNSIRSLKTTTSLSTSLGAIMVGTTHFVNALVQHRGLSRVFVVRLCGTSTAALPPWVNIPQQLIQTISAGHLMAAGGYEYDGTEISSISSDDVGKAAELIVQHDAAAVAICGVHAALDPTQELQFSQLLREKLQQMMPGRSVFITLSQKLSGHLGLLEREAAAILNASLQPLAAAVIPSYAAALKELDLHHVPLYLTGNDGTLMTAADAQEHPLLTFRSGPVNSVRGAAHIAGLTNAVVLDIGGTTTDVGVVVQGMPRMCGAYVNISGTVTNFRAPDVTSFGLGGGSIVTYDLPKQQQQQQQQQQRCRIGPQSVGNALCEKCIVCGGDTLTASDVAVLLHDRIPELIAQQQAAAMATLHKPVPSVDRLRCAWDQMQQMIAAAVDAVKTSSDPVPLIVVGGGAGLCGDQLSGVSQIIRPHHAAIANAVGAAIPQVAGTVDTLLQLTAANRQQQLAAAVEAATAAAVAAGAERDTCEVVEQEEVPVAYGPTGSTRLSVKVVGQLKLQLPSGEPHYAAVSSSGTAVPPPPAAAAADGSTAEFAPVMAEPAAASPSVDACMQQPVATDTASSSSSSSGDHLSGSLYTLDELQRYTPCITDQGFWEMSTLDLEALAIGAQILGAGGGGSAYHNRLKLLHAMHTAAAAAAGDRQGPGPSSSSSSSSSRWMKAPLVMQLCDLPDEAFVCDVSGMGAPTVSAEKLDSHECSAAVRGLEAVLHHKITALLCAEVGGGNALEPLAVGLERQLPVVDGDFMGRAFPELQMSTAAIAGVSLTPAAVSDDKGNTVVMTSSASPLWSERVLRAVCTEMGCSVGLASTPMKGSTAKKVVVPGSLSLAWQIGLSVMSSQAAKSDPVAAVLQLYNGGGKLLLHTGKIVDVVRNTKEGFVTGFVHIVKVAQTSDNISSTAAAPDTTTSTVPAELDCQGSQAVQEEDKYSIAPTVAEKAAPDGDMNTVIIDFQNENLVAKSSTGVVLACVPDLICILESSSGLAVATEDIRYGLLVSVVALPAHPMLRTAAALSVVGPAAFGYPSGDVVYTPVGGFPDLPGVHQLHVRRQC